MKRIIALALCLLLCAPAALAEAVFDNAALRQMEQTYTYDIPASVNTVVRLMNQPYIGQVDEGYDGELVAYVDYIIMPDYDATLLRLVTSTVAYEPLNAQELRITVGGKRYTIAVTHQESEYDGVYMEDYEACLTDASLPLLKAIAQQKTDAPLPVELLSLGEVVFSGLVVIPGEDAATLYDRFIDFGGKKQNLRQLDEIWPCKVETVK